MKATVVESNGKKSIVLASDGSYNVVRGAYRVGEEIEYRPLKRRWIVSATALAAAFLIFFSGFTFFDHNYKVYATVEMKGDASIEYSLNGKDEIVKIKALDAGSEDIVEELKKDGIEKRVYIDEGIRRTKKIIKKRKKADKVIAELIVEYGADYPRYDGKPQSKELSKAKKKDAADEESEEISEDDPDTEEEGEDTWHENDQSGEGSGNSDDAEIEGAGDEPGSEGGDTDPGTSEPELDSEE